MKHSHILLLVLVLGLFAAACGKTDNKASVESPAAVNSPGPDFTLKDLSGKNVSISDFRGKVVLLEFWATWCPPCKASVPALVTLQKKYGQKDFTVLGVSIDADSDALEKVRRFSESYGINYPILLDDETAQKKFNIISVPTSFLIGKDGKIIDTYRGYSDEFDGKVSAQIGKLL